MFEKIKKIANQPYADLFRDVRFVGFVVFGILVLLVSYSGVNVIQTNYELQKQIAQLKQETQVSELENNNQKLQNEYYNTDQYLDLVARKQFGKALPGETELLVPQNVALANALPALETTPDEAAKAATSKPVYQQNLEAWRNLLFHGNAKLQ